MPINSTEARRLCTEAEYELYADSRSPMIQTLSRERLERRVRKARQLVRLWARQQQTQKVRAETDTDSGRRRATTGYVTAQKKAELFQHVLAAFENRLAEFDRR